MSIFVDAINKGNVSYGMGEQVIDTSYNLGDGNHTVEINGSNTNITTGDGNSTIKHYGSNATIKTGNGNQKITSIGDNKTITTGSGDDDIVFIGDNCNLDAGNGNNSVTFWGNNCNIKTGNGNDDITTFDQAYQNGLYTSLTDVFIDKLPTDTWENWTKVSSTLIDHRVSKGFWRTKQKWVYEEHYDVETIFSRYINGVKNTNIDMGGGTNTANVTLDKSSKIGGSGTNKITYNEKWQIDESLGHRDETKLRTRRKTSTRWDHIALTAIGVAAIIDPVTTTAIAAPAAPAVNGIAVANSVHSGYHILTGNATTSDWLNYSAGRFIGSPC